MSGALSTAAENFSIIRGGPFHRVLELIGPANNERQRVINRALVAVLICWLPLLVLSFVQGIAFDSNVAIPFLRDYAVHLRFLVALPILILSETPIDRRWRDLAQEFLRTGLITTAEAPSFDRLMLRIARLRDFPLPEIIMLALAYVPPLFLGNAALPLNKFSSWHTVGISSPQTTMAGWWFWLVSAPLFRFLLLRWIWRMFLWTLFLWRTSRLKLYLVATHTDLAAGLGFLSEGQRAYAPIVFAGGVVIGGAVLNAVRYEGQTLSSLKTPMIAYGVIAIALLVVPLLVVSPALAVVKRKALREYGALVTRHNHQFDGKWIQAEDASHESILGNPDASSLVDLGSSFTVIRQMRIVPIDKPTLFSLALAAALPMIPVIVLTTPVDEIVHAVLKMLG